MRQKYWTRISRVFVVFAIIAAVSCIPSVASASCIASQQACGTNYGVSQTHFGSGGAYQCPLLTGSNYCANASVGDLTDGNAVGTSYQSQNGSGLVVNRDPYIAFTVGGVSTNLGVLSTSTGAVLNANFTVQTYLAGSYIVQISAQPPKSEGGHILATPGSASTPVAGTEMFGVNLISNSTNPSGGATPYGANPQCSPSASFCPSGALTASIQPNYSQINKYYYPGSGTGYTDTLVSSNTSTGSVSYTMSFVYEVANTTPAGTYTYNGMLVATSTY